MFIFLLSQLIKGNSVARAMMNFFVRGLPLSGTVVDVGGGRGASYLSYMKKEDGTEVTGFDLKESARGVIKINLEIDKLPRDNGSVDQVLMFNILEHIYHHQYLVSEVARILKPKGSLVGFVPFLVNYHPDPHDYFRYTKEALQLILAESGFTNIRITEVGRGPFTVNLNNIAPSLPILLCVVVFPLYYVLDSILIYLRPKIGKRYPLGYLFLAEK